MNVSYKQVRDYLNQLTKLKKRIKFPMNLEIEDETLYHIYDGNGKLVATMSRAVYEIFQEL